MPNSKEHEKEGQGTGKHPHKSAAEPFAHTKEGEKKEAGKKSASEDHKSDKK